MLLFAVIEPAHAIVDAFGIQGSYGYVNAHGTETDIDWKPGPVFSVGITAERMFSKRFGIQSGLIFSDNKIDLSSFNAGETYIFDNSHFMMLSLPVLIVNSFNAGWFSFCLQYGLTPGYMLINEFNFTDTSTQTEGVHENTHDLWYFQLAATAGITFRFRVGRFTDFYTGIMGNYHLTEIVRNAEGENSRFYSALVTAGFMFRTDVFPPREK